tara:strand:- start:2222 stop:3643 length:1422 start_codon:yes stop_codon:yes gene_type:complete
MAFKAKNKNRIEINTKQTIDARHQEILDSFEKKKESISELNEKIEIINAELNKLSEDMLKEKIINLETQKKKWDLEDNKASLEQQILDIQNNKSEISYMLNTSKLLSEYYRIIENEKNMNSHSFKNNNSNIKNVSKTISNNSNNSDVSNSTLNNTSNLNKNKNIIDWFNTSNKQNNITINPSNGKMMCKIKKKNNNSLNQKMINDINKNDSTNNVNSLLNMTTNVKKNIPNKDNLYKNYMKLIDEDFYVESKTDDDELDKCKFCSVGLLLNQNSGILICPSCGITENIIINSDKPSYKDPPKEQTSFCYKRINHLNEFLAQFQAKETTEIPEDVYNEILAEIKKERIKNMMTITPEKMRLILRKIKRNDYYEHIPYIINQLNGLPAPVIAPEIEEIIRFMFKSIQNPFIKYCPDNRKNFLSYNYVMYKFFELLELDEYLQCFQLLKSRTKLYQQDLIWKKICKELGWQYIPSL